MGSGGKLQRYPAPLLSKNIKILKLEPGASPSPPSPVRQLNTERQIRKDKNILLATNINHNKDNNSIKQV